MPDFFRRFLIFMTGYAWLLVLAGPGLIGLSLYSSWKADGNHAYTERDQLTTVTGKVVEASEVTVKRKRRASKHYYQLSVQPDDNGEVQKLHVDFSTPRGTVEQMIEETITALVDVGDDKLVYDVAFNGQPLMRYEDTKTRLVSAAESNAKSFSGPTIWVAAIALLLLGGFGVFVNRKLKIAEA